MRRKTHSPLQAMAGAIFEMALDGMLIADNQGHYVEANPAACRLLGMKREQILGRSVEDFADPRRRNEVRANWRRFLRQGRQQGLFRIYRPDGSTCHVDYRATAGIHPARNLCILRDITERNQSERSLREREDRLRLEIIERKKMERALRTAKDAAESAGRAKSQFFANISHEIRTPINGFLGTLELLQQTTLSQEQKEYAEIMDDSCKTLMSLVNELLDFSRIEAGKLKLEIKNFELESTLDAVLAMFAQRIQFKKLELVSRVDGGIPSRLRGDPVRLRQVLMNLVGNALKFTEQGQVTLSVSKHREKNSEVVVRFSIQDTGPGIPKDQQRFLFQPFSQLDTSTKRQHSGTGLGLAISKQLVEQMGGSIGMHSRPGRGSTFWFSLPFESQHGSPRTTPSQTTQSPWNSPRPVRVRTPVTEVTSVTGSHEPRILVVEDNRINRMVVVRQLQNLGYAAQTVANGAEALDAIKSAPYDLVLMDCQMPVMDGYQATLAIRRREKKRHTVIVAMTAHAMEEDRRRCLAAGMDDYISKPLGLERLRALLHKHLEPKASQRDELDKLVTLYTKDTSNQLEELARAIREQSAQKVKTVAHSALGASMMLGMTAVAAPLRRLEQMGDQMELTRAPDALAQARSELARVQTYLRHNRKDGYVKNPHRG